ncbi:MAG: alpha/beta hydrolase [Burkholderiaceae bacterium]|nr:alpha/beta hydrolase [Burkholderiaceae bacterium]
MFSINTMATLSVRTRLFKLILRLIQRKRIYSSIPHLMSGIAQTRREGPARPSSKMYEQLDVRCESMEGCEVYTLQPRSCPADVKTVLYLHGGAYCRPITRYHWSLLQWLVKHLACRVVVPLYPLAPENVCRDAVQAVLQIHQKVVDRHGPISALMGDSAGAGLSLALCQELRAANSTLPGRLVLITPGVEATLQNSAIAQTEPHDLMLGAVGAREAMRLYAGELGSEHPWVSPLHADLRGLPPMQIFVATDDILSHDAILFAAKAREANCTVELHIAEGMMHVWPLLPLPEAEESRVAIGAFLKRDTFGQ